MMDDLPTCARAQMRTNDKIDSLMSSTRNLAIANRSRVSCAYNTSRTSIVIRDLEV